jgi:hypothetical protein
MVMLRGSGDSARASACEQKFLPARECRSRSALVRPQPAASAQGVQISAGAEKSARVQERC